MSKIFKVLSVYLMISGVIGAVTMLMKFAKMDEVEGILFISILSLLLSLAISVLVFVTGYFGFTGDAERCRKNALIFLVLAILSFFFGLGTKLEFAIIKDLVVGIVYYILALDYKNY